MAPNFLDGADPNFLFCYLPIAFLIFLAAFTVFLKFLIGHFKDPKSKLGAKLREIKAGRGYRIFMRLAGIFAVVLFFSLFFTIGSTGEESGITGTFCVSFLLIATVVYLVTKRDMIFEGWPSE